MLYLQNATTATPLTKFTFVLKNLQNPFNETTINGASVSLFSDAGVTKAYTDNVSLGTFSMGQM